MKRYKLDLQVIGGLTEINELLRVLGAIQYLGLDGSNRDILVAVDGDGSARLSFKVRYADKHFGDEWEDLESTKLDTYNQHPDKPFKFSIGE